MRGLAIVLFVGAALALGACSKPDEKVATACVAALKARQPSPAGFKVDKVEVESSGAQEGASEARDLAYIVTYERTGPTGAPMQLTSACEYQVPKDGGRNVTINDVTVDGQTQPEYLRKAAASNAAPASSH